MLSFDSAFGYVGLVAIEHLIVCLYFSFRVGGARKKWKIGYPTMYARPGDGKCTTKKDADLFNCVQRAHQNLLENTPTFLTLLFLAAIKYPLYTAIGGQVYVASRFFYALGYCTGDPEKRHRGSFGYIGLIAMLGMAIHSCYSIITA
ncbi:uncharacterized protein MONBRDRAFT_31833 [Monosiga brevicollis MX1]|uniref:Glutathione S-transferase 3, mitochondrial n=1 Tax=Monosiga brevicollis TaxID=81824 RepID=A9UVN5_MONBE|nr:uncharacterized protein MONBRDRAFT_31833 [Monosiga brevicollis MX1]EDQ90427.1 predicted protein [Monosiga brevicollis MX1]|eukprot:XP_001744478.1 hypothetical protein [Monosiga brevicollis MX1]